MAFHLLLSILLICSAADHAKFHHPHYWVKDSSARVRYSRFTGQYYRSLWAIKAQGIHRRTHIWPTITVVIGRDNLANDYDGPLRNGTVVCDYRRMEGCDEVIRETLN